MNVKLKSEKNFQKILKRVTFWGKKYAKNRNFTFSRHENNSPSRKNEFLAKKSIFSYFLGESVILFNFFQLNTQKWFIQCSLILKNSFLIKNKDNLSRH